MLGRNALWARGFGPRLDRWCRPHARRFERLDFSFAPVCLDLPLLAFRAYLFGRGWIRSGESGSPPLFAPFLKVEGHTGHLKLASSLAIRRVATARERRLASECRYGASRRDRRTQTHTLGLSAQVALRHTCADCNNSTGTSTKCRPRLLSRRRARKQYQALHVHLRTSGRTMDKIDARCAASQSRLTGHSTGGVR